MTTTLEQKKQTATRPRVIAVTSGKGGVGKTSMAVNLAVALRMFGSEVLLVDADMGLGNVDVLLGLSVECDVREVLLNGRPIEQVVVGGPRGLKILPGASGVQELAELDREQVRAFIDGLREYCAGFDYVVFDTSPGISNGVLDCLMAAQEILLVTNPEPAAITDAYALLKVLGNRDGARERTVSVVMNRTDSREEALRAYDRLRAVSQLFLKWDIEYMGSISGDDAVRAAGRRQVDFVTAYSASPASRDVRKIAARLASSGQASEADAGRFFKALAEADNG
jgi:flagellar biosynthesis protein FlhG